jgi:hypothetical protein
MDTSVVAGHNAMRWTMTAGIHYNEEVAGGGIVVPKSVIW